RLNIAFICECLQLLLVRCRQGLAMHPRIGFYDHTSALLFPRACLLGIVAAGLAVAFQAFLAQPARAGEGLSPAELFVKSYVDEGGNPPKPAPNAPPSRWPTSQLPPQPQTTPPYPFTEWPFGGASAIGATVPNSQGGALMKALAPTDFGAW